MIAVWIGLGVIIGVAVLVGLALGIGALLTWAIEAVKRRLAWRSARKQWSERREDMQVKLQNRKRRK